MQLLLRRPRYIFLLLVVLPLFFLGACRQPRTPVEQWQSKTIEAHGGTDSLTRIRTIVFTGRIATRSDRGTVVLALSQPQKLRTTMKYLKRYEDRILQGRLGWRNFGDGFEEVTGHSLAAMVFQYSHLELPMGLIDAHYKISYAEQKIANRIFPALELTGADGPPMTVIIDSETGLIHRVDGRISAGGQEVVMGVGYGDYREVAGVMLPHQIVNYVNGIVIAESRYDTVSVNTELDQNYFSVDPQAAVK